MNSASSKSSAASSRRLVSTKRWFLGNSSRAARPRQQIEGLGKSPSRHWILSWVYARRDYVVGQPAARCARRRSANAVRPRGVLRALLRRQPAAAGAPAADGRKTYRPGGYSSFVVHEPKRRKTCPEPAQGQRRAFVIASGRALCDADRAALRAALHATASPRPVGKGTTPAIDQLRALCAALSLLPARRRGRALPSHASRAAGEIARVIARWQSTTPTCSRWWTGSLASGDGVLADESRRRVPFPRRSSLRHRPATACSIGNLTSQFWSDVYINPLRLVRRTGSCAVRLPALVTI